MEKNFEEEKLYLDDTTKKIGLVSENTKLRLNRLPSMYKDNPFQLADLIYREELKLKLLNVSKEKPYFARIDFKSKNGILDKCYIGKVGISDSDNNIITVDWRAPIASIYYDSNIGDASYNAPEGVINGNLVIKRQFDIENGKLISFNDVDTVSNDEILKPYLNASADNRLKNIVSTIQKEQNDIIREKISKNIIVQGVAGSGKTTVALHRVAYLVYNNIDFIKPSQYLVIGPNKFFVNYISGVLPDLDVNGVSQLTFDEIVSKVLNTSIKLDSDTEKIKKYINDENVLEFSKFRTSLKFKNLIDEYLIKYNEDIFKFRDLRVGNLLIASSDELTKIYSRCEGSDEVLSKRLEKFYLNFSKYIALNKTKLLFKARETLDKKIIKEVSNNCANIIKSYFKDARVNVLSLYIKILSEKTNVSKEHLTNLRKKKISFEDLAGLLYLHYRFYGNSGFSEYRHTVIDEAQDFGEFNFFVLSKLMPKSTFSIFGDLSQSIYEYRAVSSWEDVSLPKIETKYMTKSYRTTTEIMNEANKILKHIGDNLAEPVIRHGEEVAYEKCSNILKSTLTVLNGYLKKDFNSIAVICKNEESATKVYDFLKDEGIICNLITGDDTTYSGGVCVITSYLAKGLEFDGVIIAGADSDIYNENKKIEMKLLYVAFTRALHKLTVLYENDLVSFLEN